MTRVSAPNTTEPGRAGALAASALAAASAAAALADTGDQRHANAAGRGHGELLRADRLAVDDDLGGHPRPGGHGHELRPALAVGHPGDRAVGGDEGHLLIGQVVAHALADHPHGHGGIGQFGRRQRHTRHLWRHPASPPGRRPWPPSTQRAARVVASDVRRRAAHAGLASAAPHCLQKRASASFAVWQLAQAVPAVAGAAAGSATTAGPAAAPRSARSRSTAAR